MKIHELFNYRSPQLLIVGVDAPTADVLAVMAEKELSAVLVVEGSTVVGLATQAGFVAYAAEHPDAASLGATSVSDWMLAPVLVLPHDMNVTEALARMMVSRSKQALMTQGARQLGLITQADLMFLLTIQQSRQIARLEQQIAYLEKAPQGMSLRQPTRALQSPVAGPRVAYGSRSEASAKKQPQHTLAGKLSWSHLPSSPG